MGKYLLMERLATGGMAEVYRAKAEGAGGFEKQMAIKRILPTYSQNDEFRKMFEYEARLSSMLTHANIVQVYDFNKIGETYLLAMEFVDGKNLRQFINKSKKANVNFPIEFSIFVLNEVCKGLDYAHTKKDDMTGRSLNIIHRDMSPQNIMLSYEGAVKIVDFGIAKAKDRADETRSGVIKGKFGYMSPEQANGMPVDHKTDLFSTGIILWELLTGRRLFAAESDLATLRMIQECVVTPPSKINPRVPAELDKIVMKILSKDLKLRYNSAGDLHRHLLEFLSRHAPAFTQREVSQVLHMSFSDEISKEKKRFEQLYRQSIPYSQGVPKAERKQDEMDGIEQALDGFQTKSDIIEDTGETFSEDLPIEAKQEVSFAPEAELEEEKTGTKSQISVPTEGDPVAVAGYEPAAPMDSTRVGEKIQVDERSDAKEVDLVLPGGTKHAFSKEKPSGPAKRGLVLEDDVPSPRTKSAPAEKPWRGAEIVPMGGETGAPVTEEASVPAPAVEKTESSIVHGTIDLKPEFKARENRSHAPFESKDPFKKSRIEVEEVAEAQPWSTSRPIEIDRRKSPRNKNALGRYVMIVLVGGLVAFGFQSIRSGDFENYIERSSDRDLTTDSVSETPEEAPALGLKTAGGCVRNMVSHPPGAQVFRGAEVVGTTPFVFTGACLSTVGVVLRKDGYENVTANVDFKKQNEDWIVELKAVPMGRLELSLGFSAEVYVGTEQVGAALPNETFALSLRAGRTYPIRLKNAPYSIDYETEVAIDEGKKASLSVSLDQATSKLNKTPVKLKK
jgi:serine/threonine protein kinase